MNTEDKKRKRLILGLFILGMILLIIGIIQFSGFSIDGKETVSKPIILHRSWEYNTDFVISGKTITMTTEYNFTTSDVYAIDNEIDVYITSTISEPNLIEKVGFLKVEFDKEFEDIVTSKDRSAGVESLDKQGRIWNAWPIKDDNTIFVYRTEQPFKPTLKREFKVIPLIQTKNEKSHYLNKTQSLFEVELALSKLQADSIRETQKFNSNVLGLTWILVSLVLLGISIEAYIRRY